MTKIKNRLVLNKENLNSLLAMDRQRHTTAKKHMQAIRHMTCLLKAYDHTFNIVSMLKSGKLENILIIDNSLLIVLQGKTSKTWIKFLKNNMPFYFLEKDIIEARKYLVNSITERSILIDELILTR